MVTLTMKLTPKQPSIGPATKYDLYTITILTIPNINWYQNFTPYLGPFPNTHVITHIPSDTTKYEEPIKPPDVSKPPI